MSAREVAAQVIRRDGEHEDPDDLTDTVMAALREHWLSDDVIDRVYESIESAGHAITVSGVVRRLFEDQP